MTSRAEPSEGRGRNAESRAEPAGAGEGVSSIRGTWVPQEYQKALLSVDAGIVLAAGALGSGKSDPGAALLGRWALRHPRRKNGRPTKWGVIGPDFSLIKLEQFERIAEVLRGLEGPRVIRRIVGGQNPTIELCHGQTIIGRSSTEPNRLRGHEFDGFWLDEAQNVEEKAFRIAVSRLRSSAATRVVITGSPEDSPDWVWKLLEGTHAGFNEVRARLIEEGSGLFAFRWSSRQNQANTAGVLGTVRAVLEATGPGLSAQELEGRFPGTPEAPANGVFDYAKAFVGEVALTPDEALPFVLSVDVGETVDFTWPSVLSRSGYVLAMERWNAGSPGVPRATFYGYLEDRVYDLALKWRVRYVVFDVAKAGKPVAQALERRFAKLPDGQRPRVVMVDTSSPRVKAGIVEAVGVALSNGGMKVPTAWKVGSDRREVAHVGQLRKELEELTAVSHGERRSFDHPSGGHDDGVVSLALAQHVLATAPQQAPGGVWKQPDLAARPKGPAVGGWRQPKV